MLDLEVSVLLLAYGFLFTCRRSVFEGGRLWPGSLGVTKLDFIEFCRRENIRLLL
jgi:hypothetical protein